MIIIWLKPRAGGVSVSTKNEMEKNQQKLKKTIPKLAAPRATVGVVIN